MAVGLEGDEVRIHGHLPGCHGKRSVLPLFRKTSHWYAWQDSNLRPLTPEASALSPELQAHRSSVYTEWLRNTRIPMPAGS
jgi:hypothetical protein